MKKFTTTTVLLVLLILVWISCQNSKFEEKQGMLIKIEKFQDRVLDISDIVKDVKILPVLTTGDDIIGNIKDLCFAGEYIYLIDGITTSVFQIRAKDGVCVKKICNRGNG